MKIVRKMIPLAIAVGATITLIGMNSFAAGTAEVTNPVGGGSMQSNPVVITFPTTENYLDMACISRGYYKLKTAGDKKATIVITGVDENQVVGNLVSIEDKTTPIQTTIEIAPGEEFNFYSKGDTGVRVNYAVVYEGEALKEIPASTDVAKPMDITPGTSVEVPEVAKITYYYYKLHLDNYSKITVADDSTYKSFLAMPLGETGTFSEWSDYKVDSEKDVKTYAPGDYVIRLDASAGKTAQKFGVKATAINFGTVKCTVPSTFERGKETSVDVELVGADSDVKISSVGVYSGSDIISNDDGDIVAKQKGTATITVRKNAASAVFKVNVGGPIKGVVTLLEKEVKVSEPAMSNYKLTANVDSIEVTTLELSNAGNKNDQMALQIKTGGKWKTVKKVNAQSNMFFNKLKPATKYTARLVRVIDGVEGTPTKEFKFTTGYKTAPAATITVKKNGTLKTQSYWVKGYWSGTVWHPGYQVKSKTLQKVVITVKLKKKIKGIKGLVINGTKVKGSGTTFKVSNKSVAMGSKNMIVTVQSYMDETTGGYSKAMHKKISIR